VITLPHLPTNQQNNPRHPGRFATARAAHHRRCPEGRRQTVRRVGERAQRPSLPEPDRWPLAWRYRSLRPSPAPPTPRSKNLWMPAPAQGGPRSPGPVPSRAIDPDLARRIHEIELDLGMARFEGSERSSVVLLRRRIPTLHRPTRSCCQRVSGRSRYQSRGGGAHRGGLGRVNSSGRDVAEYNLERKHTSSTSSAGLPKRRAVDTYPCDALWLGPSWP
jgi:hypothetical protein